VQNVPLSVNGNITAATYRLVPVPSPEEMSMAAYSMVMWHLALAQ
jgi:hypothetical protein